MENQEKIKTDTSATITVGNDPKKEVKKEEPVKTEK
jgi:hypothetical protein